MAKSRGPSSPNPFDPFDFFGKWQDLMTRSGASSELNLFDPFGLLKTQTFDITKMFDPSSITKALGAAKTSGLDVGALLESQRKNIEALENANRVAIAGMQALAQRQADIARQTVQEVVRAAQEAGKGSSPEALPVNQADLARKALEKGLANLRELAEMIAKANSETFQVINERFSEALEEVKGLARAAK